jgi:hypothetical protein
VWPRENPRRGHQERAAAIAGELRKTLSTTLSEEASNSVLAIAIRATWQMRDWSNVPVEDFIAQLLEYVDHIELLSLRKEWEEVALPITSMRLGDFVEMKNATKAGAAKGMDIYLWRISGTTAYVGRPQMKWHPNTIGLKIKKEFRSKLPARALFLYLAYLWRIGVFTLIASGTVQQSIRQSDVKKVLVFGDLQRLPRKLSEFYRWKA